MADKRPCRVCRRWFEVDPRAGRRHQVCDSEGCQRKRNQRACRRWRDKNAHKVVAQRLRKRLPADPAPTAEVAAIHPMANFDPQVVRHAVGAEVQVVLEELAKVIVRGGRHAVPPKSKVQRHEEAKVMPREPRSATARSRSRP